MKTLVFAAAGALALLVSVPAHAATGYVGAQYTRAQTDAGASDDDADIFGVEGAVAFDASESLGLDIDAGYADSDDVDSVSSATAHLYAKGADYKFGGFVGLGDVDETVWSVGVEGQKSWNAFTLAGAVGYANADDSDADIYGADIEGRFFVNDNFRLDAKASYANIDVQPTDADAWSVGVGAEYQFASAPVSLRAGYTHSELDDLNVDSDAFTVGIRYNWSPSLKDRNDNGPSFAGLSSLTSVLAN